MFNVGGGEIVVVLVVALLILGPERIPGAARQIGRALAEFRRVSTGVQQDLREALGGDELAATVAGIRDVVDVRGAIRDELRSAVTGFDPRGAASPSTGEQAAEPTLMPPDGLVGERSTAASGGAHVGVPTPMQRDILAAPLSESAEGSAL